ncbi:hypothetical protein O1L60_38985 [Streptomyces diastatochromogenes]|nr:hypothetical protein [Streptomyces diastatochromogenes]
MDDQVGGDGVQDGARSVKTLRGSTEPKAFTARRARTSGGMSLALAAPPLASRNAWPPAASMNASGTVRPAPTGRRPALWRMGWNCSLVANQTSCPAALAAWASGIRGNMCP